MTMQTNMTFGEIFKGSNAQITVPVLPKCCTATTDDMVANFYTTSSGSSVEFAQTAGTLTVTGTVGTVVFQPVQLESLDDGVIKYNLEYTLEGSAYTVDLETRWYLKTPQPYTAISFASKEYVDNQIDAVSAEIPTKTSELTNDSGFLTEHQSLAGYATEQWVEGKGYLTQHQSLEGYATEEWVEDKGYLTQHQSLKTINNQSIVGSGNIEISGGTAIEYTAGTNIGITNHIISVTGITVPTKVSELQNDSGYLTEHQSLAGYATESWVEGKGYLTEHQSLKTINNQSIVGSGNIEISGGTGVTYTAGTGIEISNSTISVDQSFVATKASVQSLEQNKQDTLVSGTNIKTINNQSLLGSGNIEISGGTGVTYTGGKNIEIVDGVISVTGITVPTHTSQLTNDSGFLTSHQSLAGYATEQWVEGKGYLTEHQSLANYYTSGQTDTAISNAVSDKVSSTTATAIWTGTAAEYAAIATKSATTIYLIK